MVYVEVRDVPDVDVRLSEDRDNPHGDRLAVHRARRRLPRVDKDAVPAREDDQLRVRLSDVEDVGVEPAVAHAVWNGLATIAKSNVEKVP